MSGEFPYHTYLHRRLDSGQVFYVGKGTGVRSRSRHGRNILWNRIVAKAGFSVEICARWKTSNEACLHEMFLIECMLGMGLTLANMTSGGEGLGGTVPNQEVRQRMSVAWGDAEARRIRGNSIKAGLNEPVAKARHLHAIRAARSSLKSRNKTSMQAKAAWQNATYRDNLMASRKEVGISRRKPILCHESGVIYGSIGIAAAALGLSKQNISAVCNGRRGSTGGFIFSHTGEAK